jgi:hypothetical protein
MSSLGVAQLGTVGPHEVAVRSWLELDRPLLSDAELTLAILGGEAVLMGAYQRTTELAEPHPRLVLRRISGGAAARVGPGSVWMSLALRSVDALIPCEVSKIVFRHVRPLLRAVTSLGRPAQHGGRDYILVANRPAALIGFAHDTETGRASIEVVIAVSTPFALSQRASFLDKAPATLQQLHGQSINAVTLCGAIAEAYAEEHMMTILPLAIGAVLETHGPIPFDDDPPWAATVNETFGTICAGRDAEGKMRVGGELLVSRDALAALEAQIEALGPFGGRADVARIVTETLGAKNVAIDGVRSLSSIANVITKAIDAGR